MVSVGQRDWGTLYRVVRSQFRSPSALPKCFLSDCFSEIQELSATLLCGDMECQEYNFFQSTCSLRNKNSDSISRMTIYVKEKYPEEDSQVQQCCLWQMNHRVSSVKLFQQMY